VQFEGLAAGDRWTQRVHLRVRKDGVRRLAEACRWVGVLEPEAQVAVVAVETEGARREEAAQWVEREWMPHLSLA
jgi:hypothetical protein